MAQLLKISSLRLRYICFCLIALPCSWIIPKQNLPSCTFVLRNVIDSNMILPKPNTITRRLCVYLSSILSPTRLVSQCKRRLLRVWRSVTKRRRRQNPLRTASSLEMEFHPNQPRSRLRLVHHHWFPRQPFTHHPKWKCKTLEQRRVGDLLRQWMWSQVDSYFNVLLKSLCSRGSLALRVPLHYSIGQAGPSDSLCSLS